MISLAMTRPMPMPQRVVAAQRHFERAVSLSGGRSAAPYVTYAEAVTVARGDRREFESLLNQALGIDPATAPEWRLAKRCSSACAWLLATFITISE
jgi:hypothetical protein